MRSAVVGLLITSRSRSVLPKSSRSFWFRACGCAPSRALGREACCASRAPEFVGSVALLRSKLAFTFSAFCLFAFCLFAAPERARCLQPKASPSPAVAERSRTTLLTNSGAREAQHASRRSAREGVQPHARKYVEVSDFGTIRSRSAIEAGPTTADRTGACFPRARRDRPSASQPSVRQRESPTARRRRRASSSKTLQVTTRLPRPELCAALHAPSPLPTHLPNQGNLTFAGSL